MARQQANRKCRKNKDRIAYLPANGGGFGREAERRNYAVPAAPLPPKSLGNAVNDGTQRARMIPAWTR